MAENIFLIIVIAASVIFGLVKDVIKKSMKENEEDGQSASPKKQSKPQTKLDEIFETLLGNSQPAEAEKQAPSKPIQSMEVKTPKASNAKFNKTTVSHSKKAESLLVDEVEEDVPVFDLQDLDEVKKAVVYSEILNRKEY